MVVVKQHYLNPWHFWVGLLIHLFKAPLNHPFLFLRIFLPSVNQQNLAYYLTLMINCIDMNYVVRENAFYLKHFIKSASDLVMFSCVNGMMQKNVRPQTSRILCSKKSKN